MLVVADDEVIEEVGGFFFVGSAWFGVAGWVVVDDHDGVLSHSPGDKGHSVPGKLFVRTPTLRIKDALNCCRGLWCSAFTGR